MHQNVRSSGHAHVAFSNRHGKLASRVFANLPSSTYDARSSPVKDHALGTTIRPKTGQMQPATIDGLWLGHCLTRDGAHSSSTGASSIRDLGNHV
jgi:hypothetical protein